mgnify:CR=1 FL=1
MFTTLLLLLPLLLLALSWAGSHLLRARIQRDRREENTTCEPKTPCAAELSPPCVPESPLPCPKPPQQRPKKPTLAQSKSNLDALIAEHEAFMREFNRERRERYEEYRRQGLLPPRKPRKHRESKHTLPPLPRLTPSRPPKPATPTTSPAVQTAPAPRPAPAQMQTERPTAAQPQTPLPRTQPQSTIPLLKRPSLSLQRLLSPLTNLLAFPWRILKPAFTVLPRLCARFLFLRPPPTSGPPLAHSSSPTVQNRAA